MMRTNLDPGARFAMVYVWSGVSFQARPSFYAFSDDYVATPEQNALRAPVWLKLERKGDQFSAFYSTDGVTWTTMVGSPQTISMPHSVYIGLAITSHDNKKPRRPRLPRHHHRQCQLPRPLHRIPGHPPPTAADFRTGRQGPQWGVSRL